MTEQLLQFIWQFQYYNKSNLLTSSGELLQIINPGTHNTNQGPDFLNAKIKIGDTIFAGSIEIHINASEWTAHKHNDDGNYKSVILHVVWLEDKKLQLSFPSLELHSRVSNIMLEKYETLMNARQFIPCEKHINQISELSFTAWKERLLIERLQEKATYVEQKLVNNNHYWEEVFWQLLAKNFGLKINSDAFESIASTVPLNILGKHKNQLHQLEALLLGQAGLLNKDFTDDYAVMLKKEYHFLKMKYSLIATHIPVHFLRMRPANFPTIRLSQLAMLVHKSNHLFSKIKDAETVKEVENLFDVGANDYWHYHYSFEEETVFKKKTLGKQMIQNIIVNTVLPVLYAYGWYNNAETFKDKALLWATQLLPEKNNITEGFKTLGVSNKSAYDSQALIQLKNKYCNQRRCLQCAVGNSILKN
ncbi:MAG: DUF2851 family protein [Ferruginibacter sp.]|nr:DUF2851 family protein [Ferruginibacter sp.]